MMPDEHIHPRGDEPLAPDAPGGTAIGAHAAQDRKSVV